MQKKITQLSVLSTIKSCWDIAKSHSRLVFLSVLAFIAFLLVLCNQPERHTLNSVNIKEKIARTEFLETIVGVKPTPSEMGEILKGVFIDAQVMKKEMVEQIKDKSSFCYNLNLDQCSKEYVQGVLETAQTLEHYEGTKNFGLTWNELRAIYLIKAMKYDFSRHSRIERINQANISVDIQRVKDAYQKINDN